MERKFDVMLKSSTDCARIAARSHKTNSIYMEAYKSGIQFRQSLYDGALQQQIVTDLKGQRWHRAGEALLVFVRYHPRSLTNFLWNNLRKPISGTASGAPNLNLVSLVSPSTLRISPSDSHAASRATSF
jgi:hypothetical protein